MKGKIIGVIIVIIIAFGLFVPINSITPSGDSGSIVVTYGLTTYNNEAYKTLVDDYFTDSGANLNNVDETIITASDVNKVSQDISHVTYNDNQILSSALVDLSKNNDIQVDVDKSKITTVTANMYKSALESAGITKGQVIVTSPTTATGESALAGIMKSYETATNTTIPDELKEAANDELYTQSEIVNETNASADEVSNLIDQAKEEVSQQNTTDKNTIINIINNIASNNNIQIGDDNINSLASSIQQTQSVQDQATDYQNQISDYINSNGGQTLFEQIWSMIQGLINRNVNQG